MRTILSLLTVSALALASPHESRRHNKRRDHDFQPRNQTLVKRESFQGTGTYFYVGLGACGQWSKDSDYMVALNWQQYGGGYPGPQCFKMITVQANGVTVPNVQILDECPSCPGYGDLDLSPGLFTRFADTSAGVVNINWWYQDDNGPGGGGGNQQTSSTQAWTPSPSSSSAAWTPSPSASTSTWTSTSTSTSWTSTASSSSYNSTTSTRSSTSTTVSVNPFAVVSAYNTSTSATSTTSVSLSASSTASVGVTQQQDPSVPTTNNNLEMFNGVVTNYGQLIVVAAGGKSS